MSSKLNVLVLNTIVKVPQDFFEKFKKMVNELKQVVSDEGNNVLIYQIYFNETSSEVCLISEAFLNEHAFLNHLNLIRPITNKYSIPLKFEKIVLGGKISDDTRNSLVSAYGDVFKIFSTSI